MRAWTTPKVAPSHVTLYGIGLTDANGAYLTPNKPLRRLTVELGMPHGGTVPERLLAIADTIVESERYRTRMLELADAPGNASIDEFEVADTGRVFRGYTAPVADPNGGFSGRLWTLREVTPARELAPPRGAVVAPGSHQLPPPPPSPSGVLRLMEGQ